MCVSIALRTSSSLLEEGKCASEVPILEVVCVCRSFSGAARECYDLAQRNVTCEVGVILCVCVCVCVYVLFCEEKCRCILFFSHQEYACAGQVRKDLVILG